MNWWWLVYMGAGKAMGLKVTFINMTTACWDARQHGNSDW